MTMRTVREASEGASLLAIDHVLGQKLVSLAVIDPEGTTPGVGVILLDGEGAIRAYHALAEIIKETFSEELS